MINIRRNDKFILTLSFWRTTIYSYMLENQVLELSLPKKERICLLICYWVYWVYKSLELQFSKAKTSYMCKIDFFGNRKIIWAIWVIKKWDLNLNGLNQTWFQLRESRKLTQRTNLYCNICRILILLYTSYTSYTSLYTLLYIIVYCW